MLYLVQQSYTKDIGECAKPYVCGNITARNPFWGSDDWPEFCLHIGFNLSCEMNQYPVLEMAGSRFRVLEINETASTMKFARIDLWESPCLHSGFGTTSLDDSILDFVDQLNLNLYLTLFFNCTIPQDFGNSFNCSTNDHNQIASNNFYLSDSIFSSYLGNSCYEKSIKVPILKTSMKKLISEGPSSLQEALNGGFVIDYSHIRGEMCHHCEEGGGLCVYNNNTFLCVSTSVIGFRINWSMKLVIGTGAGEAGIILVCVAYYYYRRIRSLGKLIILGKKTQANRKVEAFLRQHVSLAPKRYKYSEIKKMTDSFKVKLGQGGYGEVYKGTCPNGRLVAVKLLNANVRNGEDFINEVASISKTSHVNVVTLLGFCLHGRKTALVYEFMPNGSLEKFISQGEGSKHLGWEKLYQIAIGLIARGLEYLHCGCSTKILHLDIKPHNILLDEEFCPKISDFGLAKLCSEKVGKISILEARGIIGYIAPEVFSRNFGPVSHKSDVYSYGMMIIEIAGATNTPDNNSTEIFFSDWIYKRLELGIGFQELQQGVTTDEESEIIRKMILVGLWCIQTNPSARPAISKVIEMLEGNIEALEIPPSQFPSSPLPQQSIPDTFTTLTSISLE